MPVEVIMPKLGMAMKEGTVSQWNKTEGDPVKKGDLIANINSEKIEMEIESPADGTILKINVPEGEGVPPGTVICYIGNPGEKVEASKTAVQAAEEKNEERGVKVDNIGKYPLRQEKEQVKISPVARKMAEAAGLKPEDIQGTGPGGRITKEDVQRAMKALKENSAETRIEKAEPAAETAKRTPVSGMRKVIAGRMLDSLQSTAQLTITMKADVTELVALQKQSKETVAKRYGGKLTMTDFVARAVILALKQHPIMNSAYIDDSIVTYPDVHLGIAVALEKGLVVPAIRNAGSKTLIELSKEIKEKALAAREGKLLTDDLQGSTFTISSLGASGVEFFTPILNPPEAGILGIGAVSDEAVFIGDTVKKRSRLPLSLTFDHRALDGAPAAAFLQTVKQYLEEPITMLL
ncbi:dihydrolipoamide acetyltransferase family protein [Weizmannia acidilactici]|uniref:dihydrolipoamide acetyltransferase family protein n=1 Tax=Weizmannia acidilactici TaxID=2607726 RepID=UPI00124F7572|nr:dihydrolipoamide acetyltransferase family protein [Weizmannia acidilactici]GER73469.1 dihydrolipoamide acetyltransferase component of pyruvate dehydrogenase complex [Weizmannia acidilactici]